MTTTRRLVLSFLLFVSSLAVAPPAFSHEAGDQMAGIARAFLASLPDEQKSQAQFKLEDDERLNWHFVPKERKGLSMKIMSPQSHLLSHALLSTGLSARGTAKALTIMSLEEILFQIEGADPAKRDATRVRRDPANYFVSIFGDPGNTGAWGWRIEGHHLAMNFTIRDGKLIRVTPTFFGSNPGEVREGPLAGLRPLSAEEDLGRELAKSLNAEQAKKAILSETAPKDIITAAERKVSALTPDGLPDTEMNDSQKALLKRVMEEYIGRVRPDLADQARAEMEKSGPISFAWAGSTEAGQGHYYRIQGKAFLLEYDNTQNNANHVHSVWRSFDGDFGRDILGEHVKEAHAK